MHIDDVYASSVATLFAILLFSKVVQSTTFSSSSGGTDDYCQVVSVDDAAVGGVYEIVENNLFNGSPQYVQTNGESIILWTESTSRRYLWGLQDEENLLPSGSKFGGHLGPFNALDTCNDGLWGIYAFADGIASAPARLVVDCGTDPTLISSSATWFLCELDDCSDIAPTTSPVLGCTTSTTTTTAPASVPIPAPAPLVEPTTSETDDIDDDPMDISSVSTEAYGGCESLTIGSSLFGGGYKIDGGIEFEGPFNDDLRPKWVQDDREYILLYLDFTTDRRLDTLSDKGIPIHQNVTNFASAGKSGARTLTDCAYGIWVVGAYNDDLFPRYYVFDCANDPTEIDSAKTWYTCEEEDCATSIGAISTPSIVCSPDEGSSGTPVGLIAGVAGGGLAGVFAIGLVVFCLVWRKNTGPNHATVAGIIDSSGESVPLPKFPPRHNSPEELPPDYSSLHR